MAWNPEIAVFDERSIKSNLIDYFIANQADALFWANASQSLDAIKDFHKAPRLVTRFPALTFIQSEHTSIYEDSISIDFAVLLELAIVHGNQDILSDRAPKYSMALESMLLNVPKTTFNEGSIINMNSWNTGIETTFDVQGKYNNKFIEVLQIRAGWHIEAAAYSN